MFAVINSVGLLGLNAFAVKVEIEASKGLPSFDIVGLADASVKESRERVRSALRSSEITLPLRKIIINLAPADVRKTGSVYDLAVAVALLRMADLVDDSMLSTSAFIGELSLSGEVRPVQGVLPMTIMAQKMGLSEIYVPADNVREASVVEGIKAYGVRSLRELVFHFEKKAAIVPAAHYKPTAESYFGSLDFADVKGQSAAKKALEVAAAGLSGGGSVPKPGEISLAHNGLLFLDELAEFSRPALEILRQPLEDRQVTISRVSGSITYPCSFMLIAAMNPCPCGYFGHPTRKCICSPKQVSSYLSKVSGPLLDRFDIHLEVAPVEFADLSSTAKEESSASIRERVQKARDIQNERFKGTSITCNARITSDILQEVCPVTDEASKLLENVFDRLGLSARAYDRILKVARTVADMDGAKVIDKKHIAMAVQYRSLDRKYWNG